MKLKNKYKGQPHRYKDNPREHSFSKWWQKINTETGGTDQNDLLSYLIDDKQVGYPPTPTKEQYEVTAKVIQWLGSPVGFYYLSQFFKNNPTILNELLENVKNSRQRR